MSALLAAGEGVSVDVPALLLAAVLLGMNGFFVAAEFALLASRRSRIEQLAAEGDRRARYALSGVRELTLMLAGAQLGITACSPEVGSEAWCKEIKAKDKGDWSANEAKDFAKHCLL